ncbi:carbohydrate binding domain-containing protein [Streptomyces sp. NBC_01537]|uniref:LamG-like jellyroll fold domain-containing protein n=1 Tax=Streptomyces sp. NBC_01537 TaxID=2903896 RepID=UPI00386F843B
MENGRGAVGRRAVITALGVLPLMEGLKLSTGLALPSAAADTALPAPVAHWAFDEGAGTTAADDSGAGHTLTLRGAAAWGEAKAGAYSLDVTAGGNASMAGPVVDTTASFSVAAWVKLGSLGGYQTFVSTDGSAVSGFYFQLRDDTGTFAFTRLPADATSANASAAIAGAGFAPSAGTWYHLVGVDDVAAGVVRLYVNGVLEGEAPFTSRWKATGATAVGRGLYGGSQVDQVHGLIDDVHVFDSALTAEQVATLAGVPVGDTTPAFLIDAGNPGITVSPELNGLMFEDINHSGEGGIYAELVNNRSFMAATTPLHWTALGSGAIAIDTGAPLNTALTQSLALTVSAPGDGISNEGFWGIPVRPSTTYRASLWARATTDATAPLTVAITGTDGAVHASGTVRAVGAEWKKYELRLRTTSAAPVTAAAALTVTTAAASGTVWFSNVSLFPPTYKNRPNGMRVDLMEKLAALSPKFLRFPGGNFLEGNTIATRFDWKKTIGPVEQRPGHPDDAWGYWSTDGLGLLEYLQWCEDLCMMPLLCVFAGYALHGGYVTGDDLAPFVQDALDEIEYITGDTSTTWGALRAAHGHPKPFQLKYVEIGNEDWFDRSGSYDERYTAFHDAIKAAYPELKLIATTTVTSRTPDLIDEHYYPTAAAFQQASHKYDTRDRASTKVFVGEWAAQEGRPTPDLNAALGDASWLVGLIRNSDQVLMESYAPLFANVNNVVWSTNLIAYDALTSYGSPSYYAQQLLRTGQGDVVVPATVRALPGLNAVITRDTGTGRLYAAVVNTGAAARTAAIEIDGVSRVAARGRATVITGASRTATNTLTDPEAIVPVAARLTGLGTSFSYTFQPYSVTLLEVNAS